MNKKKISGSYYTPVFLTDFILSHVVDSLDPKMDLKILEPSVGDGGFIRAFLKNRYQDRFNKVIFRSVERNPLELEKARRVVSETSTNHLKFIFQAENFLEWQKSSKGEYSLILGNPPYIRRRYLHQDDVDTCEQIHNSAGLKKESIKNIWSAFLIRCSQLLSENGVLAFVLPAELLQSNFTESIRKYLVNFYEKIEVFTFNDLLFDTIGQDTVLLIGYKKSVEKGTFYTNIVDLQQLKDYSFKLIRNEKVQETQTKWSHHALDPNEISLLNTFKDKLSTIDKYCQSKPGIVTAANNFFIVNDETVQHYKLEAFAEPIIQKALFVNGKALFDTSDLIELIKSSRPSKFLNFSSLENLQVPENVTKYLELGIKEDIPSRYKCQKRRNWFIVPNIPNSPEGFFFKRSHLYPKLLKNEAMVLVTDSGYQIDMRNGFNIDDFVFSFYNSLTLAFSELLGRYYGGGVLELTPREFKALPLPYIQVDATVFEDFINRFNSKNSIEDVLLVNDQIILKQLGLSDKAIKNIQAVRKKLVEKRLRKRG